tara:strand:+ start:2786 stop:3085 length:300 start_codon:yes stop_codon:yes gene_type:complete
MNPLSAQEEARMLIQESEALALLMAEDMDGPECVQMVRDFCKVMADWQPNIAENVDEPLLLGLHCLAAAELFKMAFSKAYTETDQRLKAQEAIDKAFGA